MPLLRNDAILKHPYLRRFPSNAREWADFIRTLNGQRVSASGLPVNGQGWTTTTVFSATDSDTVAWAMGTLSTADGTDYSIAAGNTGTMAARTYIYLDPGTSESAYQTSTTATDAIGEDKILVAVAENTTTEAFFQVFSGTGGVLVTANEIAANSITANEIAANTITADEIAANTITADEMNVTDLSAISADLGDITAGNIVLSEFIRAGQTDYDTGTGFWLGDDSGTPKFSIGDSTGAKMTWSGTTLTVTYADGTTIEALKPGEVGANVTETRFSKTDWGATQTFTPTWSGFSVDPSGDFSYAVSEDGRQAMLWTDADLTGTSDAANMQVTNLPAAIQPAGSGRKSATALGIALHDTSDEVPLGAWVWEEDHASAGIIEFGSFLGAGTGAVVTFSRIPFATTGTKGLRAGATFIWPL